jgi:apoptosis-inducing factor 3
MGGETQLTGPDLARGIAAADLADGQQLVGHAQGEAVLLVRRGQEVFAVGATCTHYGGPLGEGLVVGDTVRCPWHHACFSLRTGEAQAPALNSIPCYEVKQEGEQLLVIGKKRRASDAVTVKSGLGSVVIVGGGAAGHAAAEMLRRRGFIGRLTLLSADAAPPVDRPNLSKDYLAGTAPEEWIPLRPPEFYTTSRIDLVLGTRVSNIDVSAKRVVTEDGKAYEYGALLLATGADPVRLTIPGAELDHVHYLRTLADSRAIIERSQTAKRAVVIGSGFIGLEAAASLRKRGLAVAVVSPDARPLERVLGAELGDFVRSLHEQNGVEFHLGKQASAIDGRQVTLSDGTALDADLVVVGIGVRPALALAESAGLTLERGVIVDRYLETSVPGIFAAGDLARWPDPHSGEQIRVEHWMVAQRQGQIAARNMLGERQPCDFVPFFWSQHYDVTLAYVGHAGQWDRIDIDGSLAARDARVTYVRAGKALAVVTLNRDLESLRAETEL